MTKTLRIAAAGFLSFVMTCGSGSAQQPNAQPQAPATKLEAFQARTGIVLIRGYTTIGEVRGVGGTVTVDARELRDAANLTSRITGVAISVKEVGRLEREQTAFIDSDEIDSLLKGIAYISKLGTDVTKPANFEADYRTKGDLRVTVYNARSGKISAAVSTGRIGGTKAFIEMKDLEQLQRLIEEARSKL